MYNSVADYTIISDMSSEEFDRIVFSELPPIVFEVLNNYCKERRTDGAYCSGIFIYSSLDFMLSERRDINIIIDCLTSDKFQHLTVSKTVSSWTLYDCDILTKCRHIGQHGVLVRNGKTESDSIYKVEE